MVSDIRSRDNMLRNIGFSSRSFCPRMRRVNKLPSKNRIKSTIYDFQMQNKKIYIKYLMLTALCLIGYVNLGFLIRDKITKKLLLKVLTC